MALQEMIVDPTFVFCGVLLHDNHPLDAAQLDHIIGTWTDGQLKALHVQKLGGCLRGLIPSHKGTQFWLGVKALPEGQ